MGRPRAGCATRVFLGGVAARTTINEVERKGLGTEEERKRRFLGSEAAGSKDISNGRGKGAGDARRGDK